MAKGRDKRLIELRNKMLCCRWYYWTEVARLRFDDTIKVLSEKEFFISEERIMCIVRGYYNQSDYSREQFIKPKNNKQASLFPTM